MYTANYYEKKSKISSINNQLNEVEILLLQCFKEQENFFNFETTNESYYTENQSDFLDTYEQNFKQLKEQLNQLQQNPLLAKYSQTDLNLIQQELMHFDSLYSQMLASIQKRGFRNFGIEGEMRESIHKLEDIPEISLVDVLMLRRHEKDYILRQDPIYLEKHKSLVSQVLTKLEQKEFQNTNRKKYIIETLQRYAHLFNQVALYERIIGLKANSGFKHKLNLKTTYLTNAFHKLKQESEFHQSQLLKNLNISIVVFWGLYLIVAMWLSVRISDIFTKRLATLSSQINYFVNTNFTARLDTNLKQSSDEVGVLWNNFKKMENEIVEYIDLFKEKVDEKTIELKEKTEKIEKQKEELEVQKAETDQKNKDLVDGMKYAWRIQQALLPSFTRFQKQIEDGFVLFSPKDVVSGDIYWTHKVLSKRGIENIFSVIDCTGHGVPGAFMSVLALNAIEDAVITKKHRKPSFILQSANNYVFSSMNYFDNEKHENQTKDGMDMAVCKLNRKLNDLQYSGASRPLYLVRQKTKKTTLDIGLKLDDYQIVEDDSTILYAINPNIATVGTIHEDDSMEAFQGKTIKVQKNDMIYLTSDGYADQFGGEKDKKFMTKRLKKLLMRIAHLNSVEQKEALNKNFIDWKGESEQIDDVCVMGVRV